MKGNGKRLLITLISLSLIFSLIISSITCFADEKNSDKQQGIISNRPTYKEGELLIKFKDGTSSSEMDSYADENGLRHKKSFDAINAGLYSIKRGGSTTKALKTLMNSDEVEFIQPNYLYYPAAVSPVTPDDEDFDELWGLEAIDAPEAWGITQGEEDIVVAVIDTGIDFSHPELSDRMWENPGEIVGNGIDDDDNDYVDDICGWDFYEDNNSVFDLYDDHGTHVAGTIAAEANTEGVIGVAPNVKIMSLKFLGPEGSGSTSGAIEAINYAKAMGAKVANCSWGGNDDDLLLKQAIELSGMLFVVSAGNSYYDMDYGDPKSYPACFTSSNILTVAAVESDGDLPDFSNRGSVSVDVGAPGVNIYSTIPDVAEGVAAVSVSGSDPIYKVFLATFGLENLGSREEREELLSKIMVEVGCTDTGISIMLVDDDGNDDPDYDDVHDAYSNALEDLGYTAVDTVYVVSDVNNGPNFAAMSSHEVVIWFTGETYGGMVDDTLMTTLTDDDQDNLMGYLDAGKKLILFGQDALFLIEDSELVNDYFDIEVAASDYDRNTDIEGVESTVFEEVYYEMSGSTDYIDHISPLGDKAEPELIYSSIPMNYDYMTGTSMAAPHVTGIAALILSKNPDLSPKELKEAIMENGTPLASLNGKTTTGKMVNAYNSLLEVAPGKPTNLTFSKSGSNITLEWDGREAGDFEEYIVERKIGSDAYSVLEHTTNKTCQDLGIDTDEKYRYRVMAIDEYGNESDYSSVVTGNAGKSTGGGGGGGGGGGPAVPPPPNPAIDAKIQAALKNTKTGTSIEMAMVKINDTESVSMNTKTIEDIGKSGKALTLKGLNAEIEIPSSALMTEEVKKYINDSTTRLSINVKELVGEDAKALSSNTSSGIYKIGDRVFQFTVELKTDKDILNINKFSNNLNITIKLSPEEIGSIDVNKLGVYHYNEEKKTWEYAGGVYNPQDGTITFDTGHFSKFTVMRTESTYTDIAGHWAKAEIQLMALKHIIEADASKKFGPDVNITRAEIVKMLVNVLRYNPEKDVQMVTPATASFKDVGVDNLNFSFIETAAKYGITKGNADGTFGPDDTVTREQLTTMIIRAMGIRTDSDLSMLTFTDKDKIPDWAADSIVAAYERGLVLGIGGNEFGIGSTATRAQAVVIIKRVMEESGLIQLPEKLTGKLVINEIEGEHFELETEDGIYVLQYAADNKFLAKALNNMVGKEIEVEGYEQNVMSIYQRGKIFKVISVKLK